MFAHGRQLGGLVLGPSIFKLQLFFRLLHRLVPPVALAERIERLLPVHHDFFRYFYRRSQRGALLHRSALLVHFQHLLPSDPDLALPHLFKRSRLPVRQPVQRRQVRRIQLRSGFAFLLTPSAHHHLHPAPIFLRETSEPVRI